MLPHLLDLSLERADALSDLAAVHFQFGLTWTARADTAAETRQVGPVPSQTRQPVFQLSEFHLKFAFLRAGAAGKDVENETGPVHDLRFKSFFEIPRLTR